MDFSTKSFDSRAGFVPRGTSSKEMFDAVCAKCKKACKVPFQPKAGKPVYCKECWDYFKKD